MSRVQASGVVRTGGIAGGSMRDKDIRPMPHISIGDVITLPPGDNATASMTGTALYPVLNLGIPRGLEGPPGDDYILTAKDKADIAGIVIEQMIIDPLPTEGSKNAVSSGGVYAVIGDIETLLAAI